MIGGQKRFPILAVSFCLFFFQSKVPAPLWASVTHTQSDPPPQLSFCGGTGTPRGVSSR